MQEVMLQDPELIRRLAETYETKSPEEILREAFRCVPRLTFACSFGAEDMVLLDMIMKIQPEAEVFYLDTDVLFEETYALIKTAKARFGIPNLHQVKSAWTLTDQADTYGEALWRHDPNLCCNLRKVQPLTQHLAKYDGWISGIRREQSPTRVNAKVFEWDPKFALLKVNPIVRWTDGRVWKYIKEHALPYNPLHDKGYPSIGCSHCTRAVSPGEDPRSGRWAGFAKTECGLHQ